MQIPGPSLRLVKQLARHTSIPIALGMIALAVWTPAIQAQSESPKLPFRFSTQTMGTYGQVTIANLDSLYCAGLAPLALDTFHRVDSLMSNWTTTSEVARINRDGAGVSGGAGGVKSNGGAGGVESINSEVVVVLEEAVRVWRASDGAFDITIEPLVRAWGFLSEEPRVPSDEEIESAIQFVGMDEVVFNAAGRSLRFGKSGMRIDLGGIAKGYAVDAGTDSLKAHGVRDFLLDISGNIYASGAPAGKEAWRIGLRDPGRRNALMGRITVTNTALATSGAYEQFVDADGKEYGHILDPRTGRPAEGLLSVTVLSPSAMAADAWATALFVLGPDKAKRIAKEREDLNVILVERTSKELDTIWVEATLKETLVLNKEVIKFMKIESF